ncbi:Protein translocase subunit SecY [Cardinium endosymbiont cEper1 of Encarsia pergandiella]|uniref:preprotein translocase subunit SecY n=1 Tax=Cardinium endosymbiont of Encarsia pergandiella TaxID=249402 RepID=UPI00027EAAE2|nr:preprotein translocase subunit SecY [Cardinium endosymbiont of Encarsia pergandiella]CCM09910.1 Protein translocase subunit SecY [Cardinium endosymbiont cEper1 of Encarsia pergandiella]
MNKLFKVIKDIFLIKELRIRIRNTLFFLLLFRIGSIIVLPGIDVTQISGHAKRVFGLLDSFLGGSLSQVSIFSVGVTPYISASIVMQLLSIAWPKIQKIQRDGEMGKRKIAQISRILTIFIAIFQSFQYLFIATGSGNVSISRTFFIFISIIILTAGAIFCMWLGEKITDKGIGNGVTMLMMVGIVSSFPAALYQEAVYRGSKGMFLFVLELFVLFLIVLVLVAFTQATRRVPIQYARQLSTSTIYGGQRQYIPFKLNSAGVMPIIFANLLIFCISCLLGFWKDKFAWLDLISGMLRDDTSWLFNFLFAFLIIVFTFFYTAITVNPVQIAEDMKRANSFIPGITSGNATARFLDGVLDRITLPGAMFLAIIAILPAFARIVGLSFPFYRFFGGTSLLIMVSSMLETIQQVESYLLMRRYEVIINKGARLQ